MEHNLNYNRLFKVKIIIFTYKN